MMTLQNIVSIVWIVLFAVMLIGVVVMSRRANQYTDYISKRHPTLWNSLRKEHVVSGEMRTQTNLFLFFMRREYSKHGDDYLENKGDALRKLIILYFVMCAVFFLSTIFLLIDVN